VNVKKYRAGVLEAVSTCAEIVKILLSAKPIHWSLDHLSQFLHSNGSALEQEETDFLMQKIDFLIVRTLSIPNAVFKILATS